ncbi:hypothetical protein KSP40_PGU020114 [Platanthera guangdongensis]|uniref:Uncharacterized protein n=1 Tax=Platanthera guangdongensis TaxID=2320717 RepID=A0ABR2N0P2_9ASPA
MMRVMWRTLDVREKRSGEEGVEFYSNGDFYEGEFYKGSAVEAGFTISLGRGSMRAIGSTGNMMGMDREVGEGQPLPRPVSSGSPARIWVYKFYNGDSYAGEWLAGQSHGRGVQGCSDGSCFVGEFKCGAKHGLGYYRFRNGDRYAGEYFADKIHGFGVYYFANGQYYEGHGMKAGGKVRNVRLQKRRGEIRRMGLWNFEEPSPPCRPQRGTGYAVRPKSFGEIASPSQRRGAS